jgi:hypothetical protein
LALQSDEQFLGGLGRVLVTFSVLVDRSAEYAGSEVQKVNQKAGGVQRLDAETSECLGGKSVRF